MSMCLDGLCRIIGRRPAECCDMSKGSGAGTIRVNFADNGVLDIHDVFNVLSVPTSQRFQAF